MWRVKLERALLTSQRDIKGAMNEPVDGAFFEMKCWSFLRIFSSSKMITWSCCWELPNEEDIPIYLSLFSLAFFLPSLTFSSSSIKVRISTTFSSIFERCSCIISCKKRTHLHIICTLHQGIDKVDSCSYQLISKFSDPQDHPIVLYLRIYIVFSFTVFRILFSWNSRNQSILFNDREIQGENGFMFKLSSDEMKWIWITVLTRSFSFFWYISRSCKWSLFILQQLTISSSPLNRRCFSSNNPLYTRRHRYRSNRIRFSNMPIICSSEIYKYLTSYLRKADIFSPDKWNLVPDHELETPDHFLKWFLAIIFCPDRNTKFPKIPPDRSFGWIRRFLELRIVFRIKLPGWLR